MSAETGTNGRAFPSGMDRGMTLRDYFAAMAMQGIQARVNWGLEDVAELAYRQADAMLEERAKK